MPLDGIVVQSIVKELNNKLLNGKIEKIYQTEADEFIINIRNKSIHNKLLLSANSNYPRAHLTTQQKENPKTPPMFCMLMRKHLQGGKIIDISQKDFDRIILFDIECYDELGTLTIKQLIIEIMGRHSNIILLDKESQKIIDSIKRISSDINRYREILPGKLYLEPPSQEKENPCLVTLDKFKEKILSSPHGTNITKGLYTSLQGISPVAAREVCYRAKVDPDTNITGLTKDNITILFNSLQEILTQINLNPSPIIIQNNDNKVIDFYSIELLSYSNLYQIIALESISEVLEKYYFKKDMYERLKQKSIDLRKFITNTLDKLYKKKQKLFDGLKDSSNASKHQIIGDLILSNLHMISKGDSKVNVLNYYEENSPTITIDLDNRLTPSQNAQKYFKKYTKAKTAIIEIKKQLEEVESDIKYFENIVQFIENSSTVDDIEEIRLELISEGYLHKKKTKIKNKSKPAKKHLTFTSTEGLKILVGKNNIQNDVLTLKIASKSDYWFHTKDIPGSHVILVTNNSKPSDTSIMEAAELAAFFSKGRLSSKVPVDYTTVKNVKKPSGAKPGMVIYETYNTIFVTPRQNIDEILK